MTSALGAWLQMQRNIKMLIRSEDFFLSLPLTLRDLGRFPQRTIHLLDLDDENIRGIEGTVGPK